VRALHLHSRSRSPDSFMLSCMYYYVRTPLPPPPPQKKKKKPAEWDTNKGTTESKAFSTAIVMGHRTSERIQ